MNKFRENDSLSSAYDITSNINNNKISNNNNILLGEVLDIILNDSHDNFDNDYKNIGRVKIRFLKDLGRDSEMLVWAYPLFSTYKQYPVKHETVQAVNLFGKYFYTTVNYENNINNNSIPNLSTSKIKTNEDNINKYKDSNNIPNTDNDIKLGKNFNDLNEKIKPILADEGDVIFQGRFGQSIHFGNNTENNEPNIKINVGQSENTNKLKIGTPYKENINDNCTQLWFTFDENVDIKPVTLNKKYHLESSKNATNTYDGKQVIVNTDRIVFNTIKNDIQFFSNLGISMCTNGYYAIDTYDDITLNSTKNLNLYSDEKLFIKNNNGSFIDSPKIILGKNAKEPLVLGDTLVDILSELIDAILKETHPTGTGPSGPPINSSTYLSIKRKLKNMLSKQNKTL